MRHSGDGDRLLDNADLALKDFPAVSMLVLKVHLEYSTDKSIVYTLPPNPDQLNIRSKGLISLLCKDASGSDTADSMSTFYANTTTKFLAIFDTIDNIRDKMNRRKRSSLPFYNSGIMAYRVEMDDWADNCGNGSFARLRALKETLSR
ncbi:hypothetical protein MRX96_004591 [Rhipicephalus microplus]